MKQSGEARAFALLEANLQNGRNRKDALAAEFGPDTAAAMLNFQYALPARRLAEKISAEASLARSQVTQMMLGISNNSQRDGNSAVDPRTINVNAVLSQLGGSFSTQQIDAARKILVQERGW